MKKILVTGANGFVGTALCQTLRARGIPYTAAVRTSTGAQQCAVGDIGPETDWLSALDGCDTVIHLAARVHVMRERAADPMVEFRKTNVEATLGLARQAVQAGVRRFVFVSSVKVNGEISRTRPFCMTDLAAPKDLYGQSKLEAEVALRRLAIETGLEVVIVRPPLVYGPGVRANFHKLMRLVQIGIPLPLGAVHNRRSMVALDNLTDFLIVCCQHPRAAGATFLVSDDIDVSITELLRLLAAAMGKPAILLPFPERLLGAAAALLGKSATANRILGSLQVDISYSKETLDWKPICSMREALDKTVSSFLKHG